MSKMFEGDTKRQQPDSSPKAAKTSTLPREISIRFIPQEAHRYKTIGDWFPSGQIGQVIINVTKMHESNWLYTTKYEYLVAIHELIEMALCDVYGITSERVDAFDMGPIGSQSDEPGMESEAPYRIQHLIATGIEMQLAAVMGVDWKKYEEFLDCVLQSASKSTKK